MAESEISSQSERAALEHLVHDWRYKAGLNDGFQEGAKTAQIDARNMGAQRDLALVTLYKSDPVTCATLCDERLDRTGKLLSHVRNWANDGK